MTSLLATTLCGVERQVTLKLCRLAVWTASSSNINTSFMPCFVTGRRRISKGMCCAAIRKRISRVYFPPRHAPPGRSHTLLLISADLPHDLVPRSHTHGQERNHSALKVVYKHIAGPLIHAVTLMCNLANQTQPTCMHHFQYQVRGTWFELKWFVLGLLGCGLQDKHWCYVYSSQSGDRVEQGMN